MLFLPISSLGENLIVFTTSVHGGVSTGAFKSFNIGAHVGDNLHRVNINRALLDAIIRHQKNNRDKLDEDAKDNITEVLERSDLENIKWLNQQHTSIFVDYQHADEKPCDAIFTSQTLTPLAVMTADCLPIVVYCPVSNKIAAIHAGWRGLIDGAIENIMQVFPNPKKLRIWIGPSISQDNFEVSDDVIALFEHYPNSILKSPNSHKFNVDLRSIARQKLRQLGIDAVEISEVCTYANVSCFSHRRSQHLGLSQTGRMATVILRLDS
jgi:YfiH family protein